MAWLTDNNDMLGGLASLATIVSALGLLGAAIVSARQFKINLEFGRSQKIREFYADYMKDSITRGPYWDSFWAKSHWSSEEKVSYEGYVAYILTVLEETLDLKDEGQVDWVRCVVADLEYHSDYFARPEFEPYLKCYSPRLQGLIRQVVSKRSEVEKANA